MRLLAIAASALALGAVPFKATLTVGTHHPAINTRWPYVVKVVDAKGLPLRATISVAVVDPLGGVHPTEFYANTKLVTNIPFKGVFRDAVKWPPESRGYTLTFRVIVKVGAAKKVLRYLVTPGAGAGVGP
jgi:hypothetical protein